MDLRQFSYSGVNITAFRLIDPDKPQVVDVRTDWQRLQETNLDSPLESSTGIRVGCPINTYRLRVHAYQYVAFASALPTVDTV